MNNAVLFRVGLIFTFFAMTMECLIVFRAPYQGRTVEQETTSNVCWPKKLQPQQHTIIVWCSILPDSLYI